MAITKGIGKEETPLYTTKKLQGVAEQMHEVFSFRKKADLNAFHNGEGAGASIPNHEHWHFLNVRNIFVKAEEIYGFESADYVSTSIDQKIKHISYFPFAHLIFPEEDPERIVYFLNKLDNSIGDQYEQRIVPHTISQGEKGVLVVPFKVPLNKSIGSGDVAGHIVLKDQNEFDRADFAFCLNKLKNQLFTKEEINLESLL